MGNLCLQHTSSQMSQTRAESLWKETLCGVRRGGLGHGTLLCPVPGRGFRRRRLGLVTKCTDQDCYHQSTACLGLAKGDHFVMVWLGKSVPWALKAAWHNLSFPSCSIGIFFPFSFVIKKGPETLFLRMVQPLILHHNSMLYLFYKCVTRSPNGEGQ